MSGTNTYYRKLNWMEEFITNLELPQGISAKLELSSGTDLSKHLNVSKHLPPGTKLGTSPTQPCDVVNFYHSGKVIDNSKLKN